MKIKQIAKWAGIVWAGSVVCAIGTPIVLIGVSAITQDNVRSDTAIIPFAGLRMYGCEGRGIVYLEPAFGDRYEIFNTSPLRLGGTEYKSEKCDD